VELGQQVKEISKAQAEGMMWSWSSAIIYSFEGTFTSATKATALPLKSILDKQEQIITTQVLALI
jgi:hypothetical protein